MNGTDITNRELEIMKRSVDRVEFDEYSMQLIGYTTDYGITVMQRFDIELSIKKAQDGSPLLDVEVDEDGWATSYDTNDAGKASYEAYKEVRQWAQKKDRMIFDTCQTMNEYRSQN